MHQQWSGRNQKPQEPRECRSRSEMIREAIVGNIIWLKVCCRHLRQEVLVKHSERINIRIFQNLPWREKDEQICTRPHPKAHKDQEHPHIMAHLLNTCPINCRLKWPAASCSTYWSHCAVLGAFDVVLVAVSFQQGVVGDDILSAACAAAFRSHDSTPCEPLRNPFGTDSDAMRWILNHARIETLSIPLPHLPSFNSWTSRVWNNAEQLTAAAKVVSQVYTNI